MLKLKSISTVAQFIFRCSLTASSRICREIMPIVVNANRLQICMLTYNLFNWFRRLCLQGKTKKFRANTIDWNYWKLQGNWWNLLEPLHLSFAATVHIFVSFMKNLQILGDWLRSWNNSTLFFDNKKTAFRTDRLRIPIFKWM